ncbi:MAG: endonuclease MutS2, partial [Chloroflexi bacterium]|nr:endonuclease MutS2 [Chloroflexota bacterium]
MTEELTETSANLSEPLTTAEDLRAQSLERLDFQALREQLASHTTFFLARQLALDLTPSYDAAHVEELQRETAEGRDLIEEAGDVDLRASADPKPAIARAALDGVLTGAELLAVAESLEVQRRASAAVRRLGRADTKVPRLAEIADGIPDLQELVRQIAVRIGPRGEVLDDATPALRTLRRQVSQAYERVSQALTRVMHSSVGQEALQDQVVSLRSDRLVVQVKAEMRHRIPGIVHDASNSGATLFVEPLSTVDLGNAWRELALEEEREVERVLRDLSTLVGALAEDIQRGVDLVARLDLILARARYGIAVGGVGALRSAVGAAEPREAAVRLLGARHPILGDAAVPINLNLGGEWPVLVITGPNTGGKTVAMKTAGLLALMNQSGLHIPAEEGSSLAVFDGVYADVGDQQSIEQSVSTFSSHLRNVIGILSEAGPASLVLLDELGTSTDPEEGSALAKAILDDLAARGVPTIATTHYRAVAAYAEGTPGM